MTEEVDYEALPSNAGLSVRLVFRARGASHSSMLHHKVNMLAGALVSHAHGQSCGLIHVGYDWLRGSNNNEGC
jgi:hypothetical protein